MRLKLCRNFWTIFSVKIIIIDPKYSEATSLWKLQLFEGSSSTYRMINYYPGFIVSDNRLLIRLYFVKWWIMKCLSEYLGVKVRKQNLNCIRILHFFFRSFSKLFTLIISAGCRWSVRRSSDRVLPAVPSICRQTVAQRLQPGKSRRTCDQVQWVDIIDTFILSYIIYAIDRSSWRLAC